MRQLFLMVLMALPAALLGQTVVDTVPYHCDFENTTQNGRWTLVNGACYNFFTIDTMVNTTMGGHRSLYVTQQDIFAPINAYKPGSNSAGDDTYVNSRAFAYTSVYFPTAGTYDIGYWWHCMGETVYDFGRVVLTPSSYVFTASIAGWDTASSIPGEYLGAVLTPSTCLSLNGQRPLSGSAEMRYHSQTFTITTPGTYRLAVMWMNDGNTGDNPALMVDDISIVPHSCPIPENLMVSRLTDTAVTLTWTGTAASYEVAWDTLGTTDGWAHVDTTSTSSYTIAGLRANSQYEFVVRALCPTSASLISTYHIVTPDTACPPIWTFPYTFNFDSATSFGDAANPPSIPCWGHVNNANSSSYVGYPYLIANYAHTGTYSLYFYYTTSNNYPTQAGVILPRLGDTLDMQTVVVKFWMRSTSTSYHPRMVVGVMTDPRNVASFVACDTVSTNAITPTQFVVPLSNYTGNGRYVAIMMAPPTTNTLYYGAIDDVALDLEACTRPSIADRTITDTSASFTWISTGAYYYEWVLGSTDSTPVSTLDTTLQLTGLSPNTEYVLYLRSHCTSEGQWNEIHFTTACGIISELPWTEDFEGLPTGVRTSHPCWRFLSDGTGTYDGYYPYISSGAYAYGGVGNFVYMYLAPATSSTAFPTYETLVLPEVDTSQWYLSQLRLSFYASTNSTSYADWLLIGTMGNPDEDSTFVAFDSVYVSATRATLFELSLYNAPTNRSHLALRGRQHASAYRYFYVDQVGLIQIPDCPRVENVYADNITTTSAEVHWRDTLASQWQVYLGEPGFSYRDSAYYTLNDTVASFSDLLPGTDYDVWILPVCPDDGVAEPQRFSFRTACLPIDSLPYVMDWEDVAISSNTIITDIPCWQYLTNNPTQFNPYVSSAAAYQHLGTRSAYWYHPATYHTTLVAPALSEDYNMQNVVVKIWVKATSTSYYPALEVGVMTDPLQDSTFVPCQRIEYNGGTDWVEMMGALSSYTGEGRHVAIRGANSSQGYAYWYAYVDEITISYTSCPPPVITSIDATTDSATIEWTGTASSYWVEIGGGTSTMTYRVNDTTLTIGGLSPNTPYTVSVSSLCGNDTSDATSDDFRTDCMPMTELPTSYGFEGAATGTAAPFPYCWHRTMEPGVTYNYFPYVNSGSSNAHSGTNYLYWYNSTATAYPSYTFVVLPELGGSYSIASTSITLWARPTAASYHPILVVGVMDDPDSANTFTAVDTIRVNNVLEWQGFEASLAGYEGTGRFVAIKAYRSTTWYCYVDDITLFETPNCQRPQHVADSNVTTSGFDIYWDTASGVSHYEVHLTHGADFDTTYTTTTNHLSVTGLQSNTPYDITVRAICSSTDTSLWSFPHSARTGCDVVRVFPYVESFEGFANGASTSATFVPCWSRLNNGTTYMGYPYSYNSTTYAHSGTAGLYWFCSNSTAATYGAYQCVVLPEVDTAVAPANSLTLSFWAKATSASYYPVFQVGMMTDPTDISTFAGVDTINVNGTAWMEYTTTFENYTGDGTYVAIKSDRGTALWYAYMDDVTLNHITRCTPPTSIAATTTTTDATVTWVGGAQEYVFTYRPASSSTAGTTERVTTNSLTLSGLTQNTIYEYEMVAVCDTNDTSSVVRGTFRTDLCDGAEFDTIGRERYANDYSYLPFYEYYQYTYSQQIIDSAAMHDMVMVDAIEFYTNNAVSNSENCTIYLCHTTKTEFTSGSDWESGYHLVPYYTGSMNMATGWNRYTFDSAFVWDGHHNVIVAVLRSGSTNYYGSYVGKRVNLVDDYKGLYAYNASTPININSPDGGTVVQYRSFMRLVTCGDRTCHVPTIDSIVTTYSTADIYWTGGMGDYEVGVSAAGESTLPEMVTVSENHYRLNGLMPATAYNYSIRQVCDSGSYSDWARGSFVTDTLFCDVPTNLEAVHIGGFDVTIDWTTASDTNAWQIHLFSTLVDTTMVTTTHPYTIEGLNTGLTYQIAVSTLCGGGIVVSDASDTLTVTTDHCRPVEEVTVSNVTANSAQVSWTPADNNMGRWIVQYGYSGMGQGDGTTDTVEVPHHTLSGLESETEYVVYVKAFCDEDWTSTWSNGATFTTSEGEGIDEVDGNNHFTLYPNPTTGTTTVTLNGVEGKATIALIDMRGSQLEELTVESHGQHSQQMDVSHLGQGTYFVRVHCNSGSWVSKLVIK